MDEIVEDVLNCSSMFSLVLALLLCVLCVYALTKQLQCQHKRDRVCVSSECAFVQAVVSSMINIIAAQKYYSIQFSQIVDPSGWQFI